MLQRTWVKIALAVVGVLLLIMILVPFFVNAESFRPILESQLSSALGRPVSMGHLGFSLLGGSLQADNIAVADDPAFGKAPFLTAKELSIGVETMALIFKKQLRITRFILDSPSIQLIQAADGSWNFSSIGKPSGAQTSRAPQLASASSTIPNLTVGELSIKNGSAWISSLPPKEKPFVYSDISLTVHNLSPVTSFPFELSAKLPAGASLDLKGSAGPLAQGDASKTPFNVSLDIKRFDPVASGVVNPSQGISMIADLSAKASSDGKIVSTTGTVKAERLHLAKTGAPSSKPVDIDYSTAFDLLKREGSVKDLAIRTGGVAAHIKGGYKVVGEGTTLDLTISAPGLPIDQVQDLLPAVGITLPKNSQLKGGTLSANLTVKGPAADPVIAGPVAIENTDLAGFDIGSRIAGLAAFGGSQSGTQIRKVSTDLTFTSGSTHFASILADLPLVGTATGDGSVSATEQLDFKLVANFKDGLGIGGIAGKAIGAVAPNAVSKASNIFNQALGFARAIKPGAKSKTGSGIPVTITGSASDPKIRANLKAMI